jgi:hypothetical protein
VATLNDRSTIRSGRPIRDVAKHLKVSDVAETVNSACEVEGQQPLRCRSPSRRRDWRQRVAASRYS